MSELLVVPTERHVEIVAAAGARAETRRALRERLARAFLQSARFASDVVRRVALAEALPDVLEAERVRVRGPAALHHTIDAVDDALRALREAGVNAAALGEVEARSPGRAPGRARLLRRAMNALDDRLVRAGLSDERLLPRLLGDALAAADPRRVLEVVGAPALRARWLFRWDVDRAWWAELGSKLGAVGGRAIVELPAVTKAIDAEREPDPFERVLDDVARSLDEAPEVAPIEPLLGDASFTGGAPEAALQRLELRRGVDAAAQARAAVGAVNEALATGSAPERIAVALPRAADPAVVSALERTFEAAGVPLHVAERRRVRSGLALLALELLEAGSAGLQRLAVARLLRARALDARRLAATGDMGAARAALADLADALEAAPTVEIEDPLERLVATATASPTRDESRRARRGALARRFGEVLLRACEDRPRAAHVAAARALFDQVGLAARPSAAVRDALARDDATSSLAVDELDAHARDARAKESLDVALDALDAAARALAADRACSPATFRHELARALAARGPGAAGRAFAVRAAPIEQLAGEALDCLVVLEAHQGADGSGRPSPPSLIPSSLQDALRRRDARAAPASSAVIAARAAVALAVAVQGARQTVLCWRMADEDGAVLSPAPAVAWMERGGARTRTFHASPLMGEPVTPHERELVWLWLDPQRAQALAPHAAWVAARDGAREAFHGGGREATSLAGRLEPDADVARILELETGGGGRPLSVTALERMGQCAFMGFAAQVLGAQGDDRHRDDTPDRREEGVLVHDALGAAFAAVGDGWRKRPRDREAILAAALRATDERLRTQGTPLRRAIVDRLRAEVERVVSMAIDDEAWDFFAAERGFGNPGDEWPALVFEQGGVRVALRGRIDRVDLAHGRAGAQVVDYKRRVTLPPLRDVGESTLQVPVYAIAAARALGLAAAAGRYLSTVSPKPPAPGFERRLAELVSPPEAPEVLVSSLARVRALREGRVEPRPHKPSACAHCGLDGACRRPRFAVTMHAKEGGEER